MKHTSGEILALVALIVLVVSVLVAALLWTSMVGGA